MGPAVRERGKKGKRAAAIGFGWANASEWAEGDSGAERENEGKGAGHDGWAKGKKMKRAKLRERGRGCRTEREERWSRPSGQIERGGGFSFSNFLFSEFYFQINFQT